MCHVGERHLLTWPMAIEVGIFSCRPLLFGCEQSSDVVFVRNLEEATTVDRALALADGVKGLDCIGRHRCCSARRLNRFGDRKRVSASSTAKASVHFLAVCLAGDCFSPRIDL